MSGAPDPKPRKRHRASKQEDAAITRTLVAWYGKTCQLCDGDDCGNWPLTRHHLVGKDEGGDDVPENMALLGGTGTSLCHGKIQERRGDARTRLRKKLRDRQTAYILARRGRDWLDRHYPRREARPC